MSKDKEKPRKKGDLVEPAARQPFTKVSEGGSREESNHPLHRTMSRMEQSLDKLANKGAAQEQILENAEEWKKAVLGVASTPNGQHFLKMMCRHAKVLAPPSPENATQVVLNAARQEFYLRYVRPFLDANHKGVIE
jgi:hypothetical protein